MYIKMERLATLLEKVIENTRDTHPKGHMQIVLSHSKSPFLRNLNPPLRLDLNYDYDVALVNLETYYSFPNIEVGRNNKFRYSPDNGLNFFTIDRERASPCCVPLCVPCTTLEYNKSFIKFFLSIKPSVWRLKCFIARDSKQPQSQSHLKQKLTLS